MPKGVWKEKYFKQYNKFQKTLATAQQRGYNIRPEIFNIRQARGGYKQAYERLSKLNLNYFKRASRAMELEETRIIDKLPPWERRKQKLEYDIKQWEKSPLRKELEALYKDTYEAVTGEKPSYVPRIPMSADAGTIMDMIDSTAGSALSSERVTMEVRYQANDVINSFQNRELKYRTHKALNNAMSEDAQGTLRRLQDASSEVQSMLQEGSQIGYHGDSVEHDAEASRWLSEWIDFLQGVEYEELDVEEADEQEDY